MPTLMKDSPAAKALVADLARQLASPRAQHLLRTLMLFGPAMAADSPEYRLSPEEPTLTVTIRRPAAERLAAFRQELATKVEKILTTPKPAKSKSKRRRRTPRK